MQSFLPERFGATLTQREMAIVYPVLREVHSVVDTLLGSGADEHRFTTSLLDTPALALRAISLNVGRSLPWYDVTSPTYAQEGETRLIEAADRFEISDGPIDAEGRYVTFLKRAA